MDVGDEKKNKITLLLLQIQDGKLDFFPVGRAISLSHRDENVTEEKLEDIAKKVEFLIQKAEREVITVVYCIDLSWLPLDPWRMVSLAMFMWPSTE